jgi:hypothetical protein
MMQRSVLWLERALGFPSPFLIVGRLYSVTALREVPSPRSQEGGSPRRHNEGAAPESPEAGSVADRQNPLRRGADTKASVSGFKDQVLTVVKAIAINVDDIAFCQDTAARLVSTAHGRTPAIPGPCARVECIRPAAQGGRARAAGRAQSRAVRAAIRARPCSGGRGPALAGCKGAESPKTRSTCAVRVVSWARYGAGRGVLLHSSPADHAASALHRSTGLPRSNKRSHSARGVARRLSVISEWLRNCPEMDCCRSGDD